MGQAAGSRFMKMVSVILDLIMLRFVELFTCLNKLFDAITHRQHTIMQHIFVHVDKVEARHSSFFMSGFHTELTCVIYRPGTQHTVSGSTVFFGFVGLISQVAPTPVPLCSHKTQRMLKWSLSPDQVSPQDPGLTGSEQDRDQDLMTANQDAIKESDGSVPALVITQAEEVSTETEKPDGK